MTSPRFPSPPDDGPAPSADPGAEPIRTRVTIAPLHLPGAVPAPPEGGHTGPYIPAPDAGAEPAPAPALHGSAEARYLVPGYELLSELGRGGMGVVYKARQVGLNRLTALKMIIGGGHASPQQLARFRIEAEAVARMKHAHIVQIYEIGDHDGLPFFSLEFVEGGSLDRQLRGTPMPPREAAELLRIVALAMQAAHEHGIIHRDLKPANILMTPDGQPKVSDFGLAKRIDQDDGATREGAVLGTPSYMAPEQAEGKVKEMGPSVDIYALGAILYEFLTGRPPFKASNRVETVLQVIHDEPVPPSQLQSKVPRDLEIICMKCLRKEPARRYPTAQALAEDLARFLTGEPIQARPVTLLERGWKWARRKPVLTALYAATVLLVIGLAGGVYGVTWVQARDARRQLEERDHVAGLSRNANDLIQQARDRIDTAARDEDWEQVDGLLKNAFGIVDKEAALTEEKRAVQELNARAQEQRQARAARREERRRYEGFLRDYDEARFHKTLATGLDLAPSLKATRQAAERGLAAFAGRLSTEGSAALAAEHFNPEEKEEIFTRTFELLLLLAEVQLQVAAGGPGEAAMAELDRAGQLLARAKPGAARDRLPIRTWHALRATVLQRRGDTRSAEREHQQAAALPARSAADHFLAGESRFRQGRADLAIADFTAAQRVKPDHFWAQYYLGLCHLQGRRPEVAKAWLSACIGQRDRFPWSYLMRGAAEAELREFGLAEADFDEALRLADDDLGRYGVFVNRGVLRLRQGRLADARRDLEQAVQLRPEQYQAHVNLAQACRSQALAEPAEQLTDQQRHWLGEAVRHLDQAIAHKRAESSDSPGAAFQPRPILASLYRQRAQLNREREERMQAMRDVAEAIRQEAAGSPALADDYLELARLLLRERQLAKAVEACNLALQARADHAAVHRLKAALLMEQERTTRSPEDRQELAAQAQAAFARYQDLVQPGLEDFKALGQIHARQQRFAEALEDYTHALALGPEDVSIRVQRGWAYLAADAPKLALRDFREAVRLVEEAGQAPPGDLLSGRGTALARLGQHRSAQADAELSLQRGPRTYRLVYAAARIHALAVSGIDAQAGSSTLQSLEARNQQQDRALQLLREALELLPAAQRGAFWRDVVRTDNALTAIRRSPGYGQLAARQGETTR